MIYHKPLLIVVAGPTASGKTALSIQLAKHFNAEIISADSRQLYKEMSVGTAKPDAEELASVPHHFINHISIHQQYDVAVYRNEVLNLLENLFQKNKVAILCGGTGLYIRAVCNGLDEFPEVDEASRKLVRENYELHGLKWLQDELLKHDEVYFNQVDINNPHRLIRALEICLSSGKPFSSFHKKHENQLPFDVLKIGIDLPREILYQRINERVLKMMANGLEEEARKLYEFKHLQALQTVGYTELLDYFDGKIALEKAVELIQQNTRHYAKRQITWLKKEPNLHWIQPESEQKNITALEQLIVTIEIK